MICKKAKERVKRIITLRKKWSEIQQYGRLGICPNCGGDLRGLWSKCKKCKLWIYYLEPQFKGSVPDWYFKKFI